MPIVAFDGPLLHFHISTFQLGHPKLDNFGSSDQNSASAAAACPKVHHSRQPEAAGGRSPIFFLSAT